MIRDDLVNRSFLLRPAIICEEGSAEPANLVGVEREHCGAVLKDGLHCLATRLFDGGGFASVKWRT